MTSRQAAAAAAGGAGAGAGAGDKEGEVDDADEIPDLVENFDEAGEGEAEEAGKGKEAGLEDLE